MRRWKREYLSPSKKFGGVAITNSHISSAVNVIYQHFPPQSVPRLSLFFGDARKLKFVFHCACVDVADVVLCWGVGLTNLWSGCHDGHTFPINSKLHTSDE